MDWWTEVWSFENGQSRVYGGIALTPDGFAVDVFEGDTCVESDIFSSREAAEKAALQLKRQYSFSRLRPDTVH
jgi:hypothetical protein